MSGLTFLMLLAPGTALDALWRLNPRARQDFSHMGSLALLLMAITSFACATAALGLWRLTRLGYWTALVILVTNMIGDTGNALLTGDNRPLIGLPIAGAIIWYLARRRREFVL